MRESITSLAKRVIKSNPAKAIIIVREKLKSYKIARVRA